MISNLWEERKLLFIMPYFISQYCENNSSLFYTEEYLAHFFKLIKGVIYCDRVLMRENLHYLPSFGSSSSTCFDLALQQIAITPSPFIK